MGLFEKFIKKYKDDDSIPYDAYKKEVVLKPQHNREKGCDNCYNKRHDLCKGKNFSCEAFRPITPKE